MSLSLIEHKPSLRQRARAWAGARVLVMLPDKALVLRDFYKARGRFPDLKSPSTLSEKIQWAKLYGNLEEYAPYVDKYEVRSYVMRTIGEQYLVPLVGMWEVASDVPVSELPQQFVVKGTHGSGYNFVCKDKTKVDEAKLQTLMQSWLASNFYLLHREPQYKNVRPRIICEQYLENADGSDIRNYQVYCSNGLPVMIEVNQDTPDGHRATIFNTAWKTMDLAFGHPQFDTAPTKPAQLAEMLELAGTLAKPFPFVRVDFYIQNDELYFSELTFTPGAGMGRLFSPPSTDEALAHLLDTGEYNK